MKNIKALVFDLDGVLYIGRSPIRGAADAVYRIKARGIPCRFCTNTTVLSTRSLFEKLTTLDLPVERNELFGAINAAVAFLKRQGSPCCHFLLTEDPKQDFTQFAESDTNPDFVVIGDLCKDWSYEIMHKTFLMVMGGARMLALHKGRYWQTETGLRMDIGAFVAGLEYVTGQSATVIGKPSPDFFTLVLQDLGLLPEQVAMVGDDIESDIGGAQAVGMKGVLVRTGKYRSETTAVSKIKPSLIIDSVADLPDLLEN